MKKILALGIISILSLPLLVLGCNSEASPATTVPALNGGQEAITVELTTDDFMAQNHIARDVEITLPGSLIVSLGANPTTGYQWDESAEISAPSVIAQQSYTFVEPQTGDGALVGAPGKDVWVFDSLAAGTATIKMSYSRPWEGGEKDVWTLTLNITIK